MKQIKLILLLINFSWAIGLKGLLIPVDAISMASSNTGIAQSESVKINPAVIVSQKSKSLSMSLNNWLGGVKGNSLSHHWKNQYLYINSYQVDDVELWGLIPNDEPIGNFSVRWLSLAYGHGFRLNDNLHLGVEAQGIYSRLYTQTTKGIVGNMGLIYASNKKYKLGVTAKNFGYLDSDLNEEYPLELGFGLAWNISQPICLKFDVIENEINDMIFRSSIDVSLNFFTFTGGFSQYDSNQYFSGGVKIDYRHWSIAYGILSQEVSALGTPYSIQLTLHY
ncbi:MAG: hypothetical protein H8E72_01390 [Candidatus Marinimicrobia bacterium]|nr:hypothetical protein [Candidatus Neomarinimicrobiota bacterium]